MRPVPAASPAAYILSLTLLATCYASGFTFMKAAVDELGPVLLAEGRLIVGGTILVAILLARVGPRPALAQARDVGWAAVPVGVLFCAVPYVLMAWGVERVDSGVAAIANACIPIFVALLAVRFLPAERAGGLRLVGIVLGIVGVAVLAGFRPQGGLAGVAGTLAVAAGAFSFACGNVLVQSRLRAAPPLTLATTATVAAAILLLPAVALDLPGSAPSAGAIGAVVALGVVTHALAQLFYFDTLATYGAARSVLVTYLVPPIALGLGLAFLDEPLRANAVAGLVLILSGVALGSGVYRPARAAAGTSV
jgi:drug/metabolite transporter (DMT)-like permease